MPEYDGFSQFRKVGLQRLNDAEELLQPPSLHPNKSDVDTRHLRGAMYLAGYSIECALKEYIISHSNPPVQTLGQALAQLETSGRTTINLYSAEGHNLASLLSLTDLEAYISSDRRIARDWSICMSWKSTWRYDPKVPRREKAQDFVSASRRIYDWLRNLI